MEASNKKKQVQFWIGILISAACLAAIFLFIKPAEILEALRTARYDYLGLSALGVIAFMLLRAVRWRFMLGDRVPWSQVFHIQNIGYMLSMLLPFRIGDVARAVMIGNVPPVTMAQGISTMVVERVLDLLFILTLLPFTLAGAARLPADAQNATRFLGVMGLLAIVVLIVAANQRPLARRLIGWLATLFIRITLFILQYVGTRPRQWLTGLLERLGLLDKTIWIKRLDDFLQGLNSLTGLRDGIWLAVLSVAIWIPIIMAYYTGLMAVNLQPTLAMAGFVVCAAAISITVPSSPGQIGVFHAGVTFALVQLLGQPAAESASFAILYHGLNFVMMVILGVIGIYGTSATFGNIVATTQSLMKSKSSQQA
jgi:glycosyltransferase 2 family protein